jgi:carboxyl-terminal processing protease
MRRRVLFVGSATFFLALTLWLGVSANAQQSTVITISESHSEVGGGIVDVLRRGRQLENEHRWGDALSHYEEALRQHPNDSSLQQRFDFARLHYDLHRRYNDRSFCDSVVKLSPERALELYSQVLTKIDSYYVEVPKWKDLVDRGSDNLDVALSESAFIERNVAEAARPALGAFRRELHEVMASRTLNTRNDALNLVTVAANLANQRLGIPKTAVILEFMCGATSSLDPYSAYLTPDQYNEVYAQIEGNFVGLGVELKALDGGLAIVHVITGSPAEEAGVLSGDRIIAVDGRSTQSLSTDQAANLLQGEENTTVALTVASANQQPRQVVVRRRRVEVPSVDLVRIIDREHGVGYFKLTCFQKTTTRELDAALWKLHRDGMQSLIIDVRGNPGGLLVSAVEVVDRFVDRGVIVSTHGRNAQEDLTYSAHEQGKWRMPLVVIIDQDSASAAEIFSGAIRDHHRGTIVGVRSFGKGSVQGIFPLEETNAGIRLTTAKFFSPNGHPYSRVGVEPDMPVQVVAKPIDGKMPSTNAADDLMLSTALQAALHAMNPAGQTAQEPRNRM